MRSSGQFGGKRSIPPAVRPAERLTGIAVALDGEIEPLAALDRVVRRSTMAAFEKTIIPIAAALGVIRMAYSTMFHGSYAMTFSRSLLGIVIAAAVSAVLPSVRAESADPRAITITVPNERVVRYNLAAGGISPCIGLSANVPVLAMGVELTLNFRGVGQVSLLSVPRKLCRMG